LLAGGIAYRLFLWLLPTALFLIASIGLIADLSSRSPEHVAGDAGLGAALTVTIAQAVEQSERGTIYLLFLGVVLMLWAGRSVVKALRLTSAVAWRVRPPPLTNALAASIIYTGISVAFLPGAIVFSVGTGVLRIVTQLYLADRLGRVDDLYGALGLAAVFMGWLYLIGRLLVAAFAVSATRWRSEHPEPFAEDVEAER
jgi:uncharacterized BrkB/YihY/UPF0761 family membrane protein